MNFKITSDIDKQKFLTLTELLCLLKNELTFRTHYPHGEIINPVYAQTSKKIILQ